MQTPHCNVQVSGALFIFVLHDAKDWWPGWNICILLRCMVSTVFVKVRLFTRGNRKGRWCYVKWDIWNCEMANTHELLTWITSVQFYCSILKCSKICCFLAAVYENETKRCPKIKVNSKKMFNGIILKDYILLLF